MEQPDINGNNYQNSEEPFVIENEPEEPDYDEENRTYIWLCLAALTVFALGYYIG